MFHSSTNKTINGEILILHHNVQHLPSRLDLLEIFLNESKPDIIALSEHKMTVQELELLKISNYVTASYFSRKSGRGGGVIILTQKNINFKCIETPFLQSLLLEKEFECCLAEIRTGRSSFVLGCIYRSPINTNLDQFFENLEQMLDYLNKKFKQIVIAGDFNIDVLMKNDVYNRFVNILSIYGMFYMVNFPTRVTDHSRTAIDNFITNIDPSKVSVNGVITQISDHDGQLMKLTNVDHINTNLTRKQVRKFDQSNIESFCRHLVLESWFEVFQSTVSEKYNNFYSIYRHYFDVNFPKQYVTVKPYKAKQWIDEDLILQQNEIRELESQFRIVNDNNLKLLIRDKKRDLRNNVISNKKNYFKEKIVNSKNKIKTTWDLVKMEAGKQPNSISNIKLFHQNEYITDPTVICNIFNDFFVSAVKKLVIPQITEYSVNYSLLNVSQATTKFQFEMVTENEIGKIVSSFDNKYSTGNDDIPITIIKSSLPFIIIPLTHIINNSLISGIFPDRFKIARVVPIFKKGSLDNVECYRPISLLPVFSKILEKVVFNQFFNYLENNNLLDKQQHGFRSNKSTVTAGVEFIESIIESVDKGQKVIGIFLDLSRAFDSVEHTKLLDTLHILGVESKELKWFESYLTERKQFVEIDHYVESAKVRYKKKYVSRLLTVQYGVPQGSILGPLLFLCYLKGLPGVVSGNCNKVCLYADDTNIIVTAENQEQIEISSHIGLSLIKDFLNSKNLLLNSSKSNFISFSTKQARSKLSPTIFVDNEALDQVEKTKFLGLVIDENLTWDEHVNLVIRKTSSGLYALRRLALSCNIETLKSIYYALIHSHISYGICIYGATIKRNMDKILIQQKRALRIIFNLKQSESVKHIFSELKIFTVYGLYIYETIKFVLFNNQTEIGNNIHTYNMRSHRPIEYHRLCFFEKRTTYKGNKFYNCLPQIIKGENNKSSFLRALKDYLIASAFYSIQEFTQ